MKSSLLRGIPSVDKVLNALGNTGLPHLVVVDSVRRELQALRGGKHIPELDVLLSNLRGTFQELRASRIQPLINGTGILLHTNFGRAPLGAEVIATLAKIGSNYSNLEYGVKRGTRSGRAAYLEQCLTLLCGAEAATVVNNNAAALVLILLHFCESGAASSGHLYKRRQSRRRKTEVIISRGELVQIGGGFRIPDILNATGADLREVGTTNKTTLTDYSRAITSETAMILKVHRSNFYMGGFVASPRSEEIAQLARNKRVPFVEDLGSGAVVTTENIASLEHETTPSEVIRSGVDLVCFSGDKLLGGPQAGIIAGKARHIAALKRAPLFRALRCDKLILSALEATADYYLRTGETASTLSGIPVLEMLRVSNDELRTRAGQIISALKGRPISATIGTGSAQVGGGTLPRTVLASVTIELTHGTLSPQNMATRLRERDLPIIGYVARNKLKLDLRTIFPSQDNEVIHAIEELSVTQ